MKTLFLGAALSVAAVGFARADSTTITTISPDGKQTVVQKTDSMNIGPGEKPDQALINPNALSPIPNGREVVDAYRAAYEKQNKPRLLLFVNRDLLPEERLATTTRSEKITQVKGDTIDGTGDTNVQIGTGNSKSGMGIVINPRQTGQGGEKKEITTTSTPAPTGDRGVTPLTQFEHRQLEEKFRAPFLAANAKFIDQRIATSLLKTFGSSGDRFLTDPTTDAGKDQLNALK